MPNVGLIAIILGAVFGILAYAVPMKKGARMTWGLLGVALLVLGGLATTLNIPFLSNELGTGGSTKGFAIGDQDTGVSDSTASQSTSGSNQPTLTVGSKSDPVTVTLAALNKYTLNSVGSTATHRYQVDGGQWNTIANGGTFTATPQQKLNVLFMNGSTVQNYYSSLESFNIPFAATFDTSSVGGKLSQNGTITVTYFNTNDVAIASDGTANLTLAAGDTPTIKFKVQGQYQREHPYGAKVVVEYNRTSIDDVKFLSFAGQPVTATDVPSADTATNTGADRKAYLIPVISGSDFKEGTIYIDADDTINGGLESDINTRWYPLNYYVDESDGSKVKGAAASDENNALTSLITVNATIQVQ